ncbi:hypothetical protein AWE51_13980 [Aquimarina aggregata]|uniref:DUF1853 domain-containing protein n=1 Tax=Aquimarina aggregata TaxID=1642818 RepID=A0A162XKJ7_9FLAO|nr:DUF1853 family protein [Aquimarina aggregata]KZS38693.1 hypothetical protein AWE51_13980 [Aquimarina aggregata]
MSIKNQYLGFLNSSSLWQGRFSDVIQFDFEALNTPAIIPDILPFSISENEVLGKCIEQFFAYTIDNTKDYQIITKNNQIFNDKITIGEIDFMIRDLQNSKILHIELVYKFYIYDPSITTEIDRWIGPNRKDSLSQKIKKLKNKQLPLLYRQETLSLLDSLNLKSQHIDQKVCYMANLFVPISHIGKKLPHINPKCIIGYWIKFEDFTAKGYFTNQFYIPKKRDWVTSPDTNRIWFSFASILEQVKSSLLQKKSPLLWMKSNEDSYQRFFIVWW